MEYKSSIPANNSTDPFSRRNRFNNLAVRLTLAGLMGAGVWGGVTLHGKPDEPAGVECTAGVVRAGAGEELGPANCHPVTEDSPRPQGAEDYLYGHPQTINGSIDQQLGHSPASATIDTDGIINPTI